MYSICDHCGRAQNCKFARQITDVYFYETDELPPFWLEDTKEKICSLFPFIKDVTLFKFSEGIALLVRDCENYTQS